MNRSTQCDAIILRTKEIPSGARVATILSVEEGLQDVFVFGGGKSKLRSFASPWHFGTAYLYKDVSKNLIKLSDFDPKLEFSEIRSDLSSIGLASFASNFIFDTSVLGGNNSYAFNIMLGLLEVINENPNNVEKALVLFIMNCLQAMGLFPNRHECFSCSRSIFRDTINFYSRNTGTWLCNECASTCESVVAVPIGAFSWLNACSKRSFSDAISLELSADALKAARIVALDLVKRNGISTSSLEFLYL